MRSRLPLSALLPREASPAGRLDSAALAGQTLQSMSEAQEHRPDTRVEVHRIRRMSGRDPHEQHRVATPLELLFDLTFVIAFGVAASEFAHALAEDHLGPGLAGFAFATFAICWAWINFSWFASAYDTDDWIYRLMTMVQMVGVIILALGIPAMYASIDRGRARRQPGDGRRLRGDANRLGGAVVTRGEAGPAAPRGVPDLRHRPCRRSDRLDRLDLRQHVGGPDVRDRDRVGGLRDVRAVAGRTADGRHAVACPSHRRALWPADDHRARRGSRRHRRLIDCCRLGAGLERGRGPGCRGGHRADVRHVVDLLHRAAVRPAARPSRPVLPVRLSAPRGVRGDRRQPAPACTPPPTTSSTSRSSARWAPCCRSRYRWASTSAAVYVLYMWLVQARDRVPPAAGCAHRCGAGGRGSARRQGRVDGDRAC